MKNSLIIAVLSFSLLALGCTGSAPQQAVPQGPGQPIGAQSSAQDSQAGTQGAQNNVQSGSLTGMNYEQLMALGQPIECTITVVQQGVNVVSHAFIKSGNSRIESSSSIQGRTIDSLAVYRDKVIYSRVSAEQKAVGIDCDWLSFSVDESTQSDSQAQEETDIKNLPSTSFSCAVASFGDEKFATPGKTCDGNHAFQNLVPAPPSVAVSASSGAESPSIDPQMLAAVCSNPGVTAEARQALGCP